MRVPRPAARIATATMIFFTNIVLRKRVYRVWIPVASFKVQRWIFWRSPELLAELLTKLDPGRQTLKQR